MNQDEIELARSLIKLLVRYDDGRFGIESVLVAVFEAGAEMVFENFDNETAQFMPRSLLTHLQADAPV